MNPRNISRFWERVDCKGPNGCWIWTGAINAQGYGVGWTGEKTQLAHRMAWFLTVGQWPSDCLCHKCDNPICCNPSHMFEGSRSDNLKDMRKKGRGSLPPKHFGETNRNTPFSSDDIRKIRREAIDQSYSELGRKWGVSYQAIRNIVLRVTWKHVE